MNEDRENIIIVKSYSFALEIVRLYEILVERREFVLSKQLLRSGASVGANIHEAIASESKKEFIHKLSIAAKEARETSYWLNLLKDGQFITVDEFDTRDKSCNEIVRILSSIILTTKERYFANS